MTRPGNLVRIVVLGVGLAYSLILALAGVHLNTPSKAVIGWLPAAASIALLGWDLRIWRIKPFHRLCHRPRIDGLWEAVLQPSADSHIPAGGNRGPIKAYLVVSQTFWSLHVRQLTAESASDSRSFFWARGAGVAVDRHPGGWQPRPDQGLGAVMPARSSFRSRTNGKTLLAPDS